MKRSIFERLVNAGKAIAGTLPMESGVGIKGYWDVKVVRADGTIEEFTRENSVTARGMNRMADLCVHANVVSWAAYIVVGTNTGAPADTDTQAQMGEVTAGRKIAAVAVQSREWVSLTSTWAGNADGLTGIALDSAGMADYASSWATDTGAGSGSVLFNRVNGMGVTLQASDFLNLTVRIRVGSHNQAHTQ